MVLFLTTLDFNQQERQFSCSPDNYEIAFNFLNHVVANGHPLLSVSLEEGGRVIALPVEAFDGLPVRDQLQQLQRAYTAVLELP